MCGIAGFSGQFSGTLLTEMGMRIAHRGPDDTGEKILSHENNKVGLVHRRLSIIDLSAAGQQPFTVNCQCCQSSSENGLWLTYNGELYNYQELRDELIAKGHQFSTKTDSEVLLHLYAQEGTAMLTRLNGIFAFAIYDDRAQNTRGVLFIARDGVGVKPLYYSVTPSGFLFASELKALLASDEVKADIDLTAIHYYLSYLWCPGQQTALQEVKKLQAGEAMIVRNGQINKRWFFYDFPYEGIVSTASEADIAAELADKLQTAVARQLVADVPVGAFLSGGLDSSAIVAMMKKLNPDADIQTYCIGFKNGMASEGNVNDVPYAKTVAKHLNVNLNVLEVEADIISHLQKMIYHLDEPQADPAPIHVYLIAEAAKRDGIKVLLSGAGGDDIFSGYRRHQTLQLEHIWKWLPMSMRKNISHSARKILDGGYAGMSAMRKPIVRRLAKLLAPVDLTVDKRIANHFMWGTESLRRNLYTKDMANHVEFTDTALPLLNTLDRIPLERGSLNRMLYLEGKHFLTDHNLNYTDKMAMALGVEVRVPLLDPDLIAFAAQIPARFKQRGNTGKAIFKKAMEPYLPKSTIYRSKTGFGAPLRQWLHNELQDFVRDTLSASALKRRGIFDAGAVNKLLDWDKSGRVDGAYTIFSVLCIELWANIFIDGRAAL
jgi:asparagine synthase (glutamine-hydrolysing)